MSQLQARGCLEMVIEKAKRLVEHKKDVMFYWTRLLDWEEHTTLLYQVLESAYRRCGC